MQRLVGALAERTFDVLVVGGGIYGLTVCADLAQRGLSVALIDRADFGSGNSFNHLRTIHGGLRYLQTLDVVRARESVRERRTLARIAPHAVRPLAFALPLTHSVTRGKMAMRAAFLLDRVVGFDRNQGVAEELRLPAGQVLAARSARKRFPDLPPVGLTGAAVWYDYTIPESDRLTMAWLAAAVRDGATPANYVEAIELLLDGRRTVGVRARDVRSGDFLEIRARLTVNACGSGIDLLLARAGVSTGIALLRAMNLVTRREPCREAIGARSASGRHVFQVPWRGRALFGTWQSTAPCSASDTTVHEDEVGSFIHELNDAFPSLHLTVADVTLVHRGLVPAAVGPDGAVSLEGRRQIVDHAERAERLEGLVTVAGTKYTTARAVAESVSDRVLVKLRMPPVPCRTATVPLPGGDIEELALAAAEAREAYRTVVDPDTIQHLLGAYGSRCRQVLALGRNRPELNARVANGCPVIGAEILWALKYEMAVTLGDVVVRRTPLGAVGHPGQEGVARAAAIAGSECGWSAERLRSEIAALDDFYAW